MTRTTRRISQAIALVFPSWTKNSCHRSRRGVSNDRNVRNDRSIRSPLPSVKSGARTSVSRRIRAPPQRPALRVAFERGTEGGLFNHICSISSLCQVFALFISDNCALQGFDCFLHPTCACISGAELSASINRPDGAVSSRDASSNTTACQRPSILAINGTCVTRTILGAMRSPSQPMPSPPSAKWKVQPNWLLGQDPISKQALRARRGG